MKRINTIFALLAGGAFTLLPGCVTEVTRGGSPVNSSSGESRTVKPAPPGTRASQMLLVAGVPNDADANGYPDTVPVVVYLFAPANVHPLPLRERGEFRFQLRDQDGRDLGEWSFSPDFSEGAAQSLPPGEGYVFGLRLAPGRDRLRNQPTSLTAQFVSSRDGRIISSSGSASVRMGAGQRQPPTREGG